MKKKVIAVLLVLLTVLSMVLAGCSTPVSEDMIDPVAEWYFNREFGEQEYTYERNEDKVITAADCYVLTAKTAKGMKFTIAINKENGAVYNYGIDSGKAQRIGSAGVAFR